MIFFDSQLKLKPTLSEDVPGARFYLYLSPPSLTNVGCGKLGCLQLTESSLVRDRKDSPYTLNENGLRKRKGFFFEAQGVIMIVLRQMTSFGWLR